MSDGSNDPGATQRVPGKLIPTHGLRWNCGTLQQRFLGLGGGPEYWIDVPTVGGVEYGEPKNVWGGIK